MNNDNIIQFAAKKLGVEIEQVVISSKTTGYPFQSTHITQPWVMIGDTDHYGEVFYPFTWEWMGKGLEIMFNEGLHYCIQPREFIFWPENKANKATAVTIRNVNITPEAFWQCWMAVDGAMYEP